MGIEAVHIQTSATPAYSQNRSVAKGRDSPHPNISSVGPDLPMRHGNGPGGVRGVREAGHVAMCARHVAPMATLDDDDGVGGQSPCASSVSMACMSAEGCGKKRL
jgi:hypothetical protein